MIFKVMLDAVHPHRLIIPNPPNPPPLVPVAAPALGAPKLSEAPAPNAGAGVDVAAGAAPPPPNENVLVAAGTVAAVPVCWGREKTW